MSEFSSTRVKAGAFLPRPRSGGVLALMTGNGKFLETGLLVHLILAQPPSPLGLLLEQLPRARSERRREPPDGIELGIGGCVLDLGDQPLMQVGVGRERLLGQRAQQPEPAHIFRQQPPHP
jgi:hypothetical protein